MNDTIERLEETIRDRLHNGLPETSYVARRARQGRLKIAQKLGEEAVETVIAAISEPDSALIGEAADLIFHLLILLNERGLGFGDVCAELQRREGLSGIEEKARRI